MASNQNKQLDGIPDVCKFSVQHGQIDQGNEGLTFSLYVKILNSRLRGDAPSLSSCV